MRLAFERFRKDECSKIRGLLSGYMDQRLDPEEVAHVEGHLRACLRCREELESLRATVALLHRLPEMTPSRRFAVAPARPLPGRRALPALRFATAGVALLLVVAFAIDLTNVVEKKESAGSYLGITGQSGGNEAYWTVPGVRNYSADDSETVIASAVNLVVPDGSDNIVAAVDALETDGVVWGADVEVGAGDVPQLVLMEGEEGTANGGNLEEFVVVSDSRDTEHKFATSDAAVPSELDPIVEEQEGPYLNILSSDNNVLYSFSLNDPEIELKTVKGNDWLRPLEYSLIGLVVVLAGVTAALWLRQKRAIVAEVT